MILNTSDRVCTGNVRMYKSYITSILCGCILSVRIYTNKDMYNILHISIYKVVLQTINH